MLKGTGGVIMQVKVNVSSAVIDWIMTQINLDSISVTVKNNLLAWQNGTKTPTYNQIEAASRSTGIPFGYFFLKTPPTEDLSLIDYRTVDSLELLNPSRELLDTIHYLEEIQDWAKNDVLSNGGSELQFVGKFKNTTDINKIAKYIRTVLNISIDWFTEQQSADYAFNYIRNAISRSGVIVMISGIVGNNTRRTLSIEEFRAFAMVDNVAPVIFVNSNDSKGAKLFSLLHEFVHVCLGQNSLFNANTNSAVSKTEQICNAVAAEILVPSTIFIDKWNNNYNTDIESRIQVLTKYFKCSELVIARRALDNKFITDDLYQNISEIAKENYIRFKKNQKANQGGDFYKTLASRVDKVFFNRLLSSLYEGKTQYSEAFKLTNTNRSTFSEMVSRAGGVI